MFRLLISLVLPIFLHAAYIQGNYATPQASEKTVSVGYTSPQSAGDANVIVIGWNDSSASVSSVRDSVGNTYTLAVGPAAQSGKATQSIYYCPLIAGGSNVLTVTFSKAAKDADIRVLEYSGIGAVDAAASATGSGATASVSIKPPTAGDLIVAADLTQGSTNAPGSGFTSRMITSPDSDIVEDEMASTSGTYKASASTSNSAWIMQAVAFRPAQHQVTLNWSPSSATCTPSCTATITYNVLRAQTSGGPYTQIAAGLENTTYIDTSVSPGTYYYVTTAADVTGVSGYSNQVSATVP